MADNIAPDDAFGFASVSSTKEKIKSIRPSSPDLSVDMSRIDAIADSVGFVSREAVSSTDYAYRSARRVSPEPRIPLNMRVPVTIGSAFQRFCEDNRYSYPEALAEIMQRAGIPMK